MHERTRARLLREREREREDGGLGNRSFRSLETESGLFHWQCWRRHWVVLDIIPSSACHSGSPGNAAGAAADNSASGKGSATVAPGGECAEAALIARIYGSHLHEGRSLPYSTVTITDVHGLHRIQSRFVVDKFLIEKKTRRV